MHKITAELIVFFSAMIPFVEIKAAIPLGFKLGLSSLTSYIFAVSGTIIPGIIYLMVLGPLTKYLRKKSSFLDKYIAKLFEKTQKNHSNNVKKFGSIFLLLFVGIPIPGSGTMTGALIAFVFGMEFWTAITMISIGAMISGAIVLGGVSSIMAILHSLH